MRTIDGEGMASPLQEDFNRLVSTGIQPFLEERGFTRNGLVFRRERGEMYDVIGIQENWHNAKTLSFGFFINVGVGSAAVDAAWKGPPPLPLLDRRWEDVVPELPYEVRFNGHSDMTDLATAMCAGLDDVITRLALFDCTSALVEYAVAHNLLIQYERTCCYLASVADIDTLARYVGRLRDAFGHQERWAIFNREISEVTGSHAQRLVEMGLLDPVA